MRDKLEYSRCDLDPEVEEDARGQELLLLGVSCGTDIFQVDRPQLGEDEGVEEAAHVNHRGLAQLSKPGQDDLDVVSNMTAGLQWYWLTWRTVPGG